MNLHCITLPTVQAAMWAGVCLALGLQASLSEENQEGTSYVVTRATDEDRETAWQLFREQFADFVN